MRVVNRSGQDIEYRVSGGGGLREEGIGGGLSPIAPVDGWVVLTEGQELDIPDGASALEVRVGEKRPTEIILDAIDDLVEVGRNLRVRILKTTGSGNRR